MQLKGCLVDWEPFVVTQEDVQKIIKVELLEHSEAGSLCVKLKALMKANMICQAYFKLLKLEWSADIRKISPEQQALQAAEDMRYRR